MKRTGMFAVVLLLAGSVLAGTAHDNAADAAYDDGWQNLDDGGYGFGAWVMGFWATNGVDRIGIGSSTSNGGTNSIDTAGRAFYIQNVDGTNEFISVFRYLDEKLQPGQSFSFDMDVNFRNGYKGLRVRDEDDNSFIFQIEVGNFDGNDGTRVTDDVAGNTDIGGDYSDDTQYNVVLEQTSTTGGVWKVTRSGGLSDVDSGSYTSQVNSIVLYSIFAESADENRIFYNNFDVSYIPGFDHYGAWTKRYGLSGADADAEADPDNDKMANLVEFSVGRNPTIDEGGFRAPEYLGNSTNGLVYVYTRYKADVAADLGLDYTLVTSDSLTASPWDASGFTELPPAFLFADLVTVTNYVPTTNDVTFATLQVEAL